MPEQLVKPGEPLPLLSHDLLVKHGASSEDIDYFFKQFCGLDEKPSVALKQALINRRYYFMAWIFSMFLTRFQLIRLCLNLLVNYQKRFATPTELGRQMDALISAINRHANEVCAHSRRDVKDATVNMLYNVLDLPEMTYGQFVQDPSFTFMLRISGMSITASNLKFRATALGIMENMIEPMSASRTKSHNRKWLNETMEWGMTLVQKEEQPYSGKD